MRSTSKFGCKDWGRAKPEDIGLDAIDAYIGGRVRLRRTMLGLSQKALSERLRVTFQQVQKYERGATRIGASRLWQLSHALDAPVSFFFDDMPAELGGAYPLPGPASEAEPSQREMLALVQYYARIGDPKLRHRMLDLLRETGAAFDRSAE